MQNWDTMQPTANYDQHNSWYNNMFAANIKSEPGTNSPTQHLQQSPMQSPPAMTTTPPSTASQLEHYLKQQHQQHLNHHGQQHQHYHQTQLDSITAAAAVAAAAMTPSPSQNDSLQHFFDTNMQQQLLQQQQYQQQFQQAQQAAAQNQVAAASSHLSLGFNPLTPPGLPNAVLPSINHFYQNSSSSLRSSSNPQTPSPQPSALSAVHNLITPNDSVNEKLQAALTPRNTPPMDVTPPKSPSPPKSLIKGLEAAGSGSFASLEKDQDQMSNSSEDMKYESEDDESIRVPIYNSHGKMKHYKCKTCGLVAITKVAFWEHTKSHMKPEKILQCPKCPFVTELKHHLEYHIRKHKNLKPFQCDKCSYSCVNKSMLNSHRKSHSSVYQYRCADCDYATKYCHSFKLHLRKYDHKPGMVLDEQGLPNPSIVIDVYGTRRGPKTKSSSGNGGSTSSTSSSSKRSSKDDNNSSDMKYPSSQLSAALQGFPLNHFQQQNASVMPVSPAKSSSSAASDLHQLSLNLNHHKNQTNCSGNQGKTSSNSSVGGVSSANGSSPALPSLLPLSAMLQQNPNMNPFFPYWNLNLQMLAAQQQAAVLAQLSPRMRETALQNLQKQNEKTSTNGQQNNEDDSDDDEEEDEERPQDHHHQEDEEMDDQKSVDSAMDLSQGTPTKEEEIEEQNHHQQMQKSQTYNDFMAMNLKMKEDSASDTPLLSSSSSSRRKGRVLKLDSLTKSASQSPEALQKPSNNKGSLSPCLRENQNQPPAASSPIAACLTSGKNEEFATSSADESMEHPSQNLTNGGVTASSANTSSSSTASSSGNSSNSSNASSTSVVNSAPNSSSATNSTSGNSSANSSPAITNGAIYECKYCDIYFKDAVLYTIHMGYHSCDDVFKCNMCGEKCDSPVGLFVHMARNAHS